MFYNISIRFIYATDSQIQNTEPFIICESACGIQLFSLFLNSPTLLYLCHRFTDSNSQSV